MKKIISLVLAVVMFACLLVPAMTVNAATAYTYYVSATGSDTDGDGSEAKPFQNIAAAIDKALTVKYVEGDTVKPVIVGEVDACKTDAALQYLAGPSTTISTGTIK